ncbi:hypothetical protein RclHR1_10080005 [Rhizophagus clarus]|uniref:F-box domain-containing protein n=1 Tax=Rhizophagus clarus TaxID=94130 RepID=A0A2Z6Q5A3_9GLOM|nr:hypothetical protein RclHR1_10080005 [Rhizophagus clarus]GES99746.1 hypothetical protein GLOIN_2v1883823 [Rhizophagus clarus]
MSAIYSILDQSYAECHDIIMNNLQNDVNTLYSCILVNRRFCRIFIPILWKNPFKFVKKEKKLIEIFNTLIHCLELTDKQQLITERLINIVELPTTLKAYFKYHSFIKEFELNSLLKGMRLWISKYITKTEINESSSTRVKDSVITINQFIGKLFFNADNQYESMNIYYNDLLGGPSTLFSMCDFVDNDKSFINVNKLSLGFSNKNSTNLMPIITMNILSLQIVLSPNIQHLQISIDTTKEHSQFTYDLINFIKFQNNLKSLLISPFCKNGDFELYFIPLLDALKNHSNSLTFLKLKSFSISINQLLLLLNSLPNLITLEIDLIYEESPNDYNVSNKILNLPTSLFKKLKHLDYSRYLPRVNPTSIYSPYSHHLPTSLFKQILLSSSDNLKSLKIRDTYYPFIKDVQQLCNLNLSHFHLLITIDFKFGDLSSILENLHHLVHLKLSSTSPSYLLKEFERLSFDLTDYLHSTSGSILNHTHIDIYSADNIFKIFARSLPSSLKILEISFLIPQSYLEILLNESLFKLQSIKLYGYGKFGKFKSNLLRIFIDYQKKNNCFKELGINRINRSFETCMKEAKNPFKITKNTSIDDPFYDIPIKISPWSGDYNV